MATKMNLAGQVFNGIEFISFSHLDGNKARIWNCKCYCGKVFTGHQYNVRAGKIKSCGCLRKVKNKENAHKLRKWINTDPEIHKIWTLIKNRCCNKNSKAYKYYGGRGIIICDTWKNNFDEFYNWIRANLGERPDKTYTLDRVDNNSNYEPGNLRWASKSTQAQNSRNTKLNEEKVKEIRESKLSVVKLAKKYNVARSTIYEVINNKAWR